MTEPIDMMNINEGQSYDTEQQAGEALVGFIDR